jgi:hypothetical protein
MQADPDAFSSLFFIAFRRVRISEANAEAASEGLPLRALPSLSVSIQAPMFPSGKIAPENSRFSENAFVREHREGTLGSRGHGREREHTAR